MRTSTGVGVLAIALLVFGSAPARAQAISPVSPAHYLPGVIGIRDAVTPPPDLFLIWSRPDIDLIPLNVLAFGVIFSFCCDGLQHSA